MLSMAPRHELDTECPTSFGTFLTATSGPRGGAGAVRSCNYSVTCYLLLSCLQGARSPYRGGCTGCRPQWTALHRRSSEGGRSVGRSRQAVDRSRRSCDRNDRGVGLSPGARNTILGSRLDCKVMQPSRNTHPHRHPLAARSRAASEALICTTDECRPAPSRRLFDQSVCFVTRRRGARRGTSTRNAVRRRLCYSHFSKRQPDPASASQDARPQLWAGACPPRALPAAAAPAAATLLPKFV